MYLCGREIEEGEERVESKEGGEEKVSEAG